MSQVKGIPYGISDFKRLRNENFYYVDKTIYLPLIEKMPSYLFLIRPRRFGKSLFLSLMRTYYDILQKDNFEKYFGDLWIGSHPTDQRNRFQVLYFDFSKAGCSQPGTDMMTGFNDYCSLIINQFAHEYASYYDADYKATIENIASAKAKLSYIEIKAKEKGYPLYLIVDEYDNFTNVILSEHGQKMFHDLTHASGFYREYFKQFKGMFDRIFLMGVSPITLDDLSSGYNIDWNISTDETFNAMMGFDETDVREMFHYYRQNDMLTGDIDTMIAEMKPWYNNYCFARMALDSDRVFNCDMTLYYLNYQIQKHRAPEDMVDKNIRTDYSKLKMLARIDHDSSQEGSRMSTIEEIAAKGEILVDLHTSFPAEKVTDIDNFRSLLYYYGLLTMCGTHGNRLKMCIPNNCVREQYFGFLRDYYQQFHTINLSHLKDLIDDLAYDGQWKPFFESIALAYRENSSVRDAMEGERNLQGFLKAYLALASYYLVEPELEMNYGYCDFFLLPDKKRYPDIGHSYILELKYAARTATDAELETQAEEGRRQLLQYSKDKIALQLAKDTTLHLILLQFRGWDLIKCEEIASC
ncbi:ATP-binding protein [Parabacteroides sp. W1-Q-101]|uniref:ATP-binding protein n=1 Tax=Parabacteroides TaxID=375288 RepID=UPI0020307257|nr:MULTISPECIES: ATP-binding protein [Parabacteroides]MCM0718295.1 ATP-binding protein [Parabacteroides sp. W1-Q-101]